MFSKFREPVSGFTHLFGAILSVVGMIILLAYSNDPLNSTRVISLVVFCMSLILLYTASSTYHLVSISEKGINILRKIDHSMIYVLIAGTYTPICLIALKGTKGIVLFTSICTLAVIGIVLKIVWFNAPRWLYTLFYVVMGWLAIFAIAPLAKTLPMSGIAWLVGGGVAYTVGALIYGTKWPKIKSKVFGFHEIFHLFVLLGSFCHYWLIFKYIIYIH